MPELLIFTRYMAFWQFVENARNKKKYNLQSTVIRMVEARKMKGKYSGLTNFDDKFLLKYLKIEEKRILFVLRSVD